jgi:hypothetical protein
MFDATFELEQIYGTVCCGICGDTGYVWGKPECGQCECGEDEIEENDLPKSETAV